MVGILSQNKVLAVAKWGLKTGDYTARGLEKDQNRKKASTGEIAMNLGKKEKRSRLKLSEC